MRIAVFHPWLDNIGGAEIVALEMARGLSGDLYTTNISPEKIKKMGFEDVLPRIKSIGKVPINAPYRHQKAFFLFRGLKLKDYDKYIIAGDWAMFACVKNRPSLWYIHSPFNELYEFRSFVRESILSFWKKPLFDLWVSFIIYFNKRYLKYIDTFVCNSENTKNRIKKYYNKNAEVINPSIDVSSYEFSKVGDYWLSVNRLTPAKRIDLQLNSFRKLPNEKLVIVGSYEENSKTFEDCKNELKNSIPENVELKSWVDREELLDLYANCKGFITTSMNEDFGMTPVEAMASGKLVIAPNEGGFKETIIHNKTGILIDNISPDKIVDEINRVNKFTDKDFLRFKENCISQAKKFDIKEFIQKIRSIIE